MTRRLANITLDNLDDLPAPLPPVRVLGARSRSPASAPPRAGDTGLEKEAWVSAALLEWGSCGKVLYVDGVAAGFVMFAPPSYVPRSVAFPTSPVSADAVLLMTATCSPSSPAAASAGCWCRASPRTWSVAASRRSRRSATPRGAARPLRAPGRLPARGRVQDRSPAPALPAAAAGAEVGRRPGGRTSRSRSSGCSAR